MNFFLNKILFCGFFLFDLGWYYAMYCLDVNILKFDLDAVWYRHYPNNVKNTFLEKRGYFKEKRRIPYIFTDPWTIETRIILHSYVYLNKKVPYWEGFFQFTWTIWLLTSLAVKGISCTRCSPVSWRRVGARSASGPDPLTTRHGTLGTPPRPASPSSINWFIIRQLKGKQ